MTTHPMSPGAHAANLNGTTIRYRVRGRGPVLVVQPPGWGVGGLPYEEAFAPLEDSFTLVHLAPRGSVGAPPERPADLHVGTFVDDLEALRAHLGLERMALAGHSHGGLIALHYALRHPERVQGLLLLCAQLVGLRPDPHEPDKEVDPRDEPEIAQAYGFLRRVGGFGRLFSARTDAEFTDFMQGIAPLYFRDPSHAAGLRALLAAHPLPVATVQAVSGTDGAFALEDHALRACPVPTLAVGGRYDLFCPPSGARTLARTMPHARLLVFESSGHFPWIEEPAAFFPAVAAFLRKTTLIPAR